MSVLSTNNLYGTWRPFRFLLRVRNAKNLLSEENATIVKPSRVCITVHTYDLARCQQNDSTNLTCWLFAEIRFLYSLLMFLFERISLVRVAKKKKHKLINEQFVRKRRSDNQKPSSQNSGGRDEKNKCIMQYTAVVGRWNCDIYYIVVCILSYFFYRLCLLYYYIFSILIVITCVTYLPCHAFCIQTSFVPWKRLIFRKRSLFKLP